MIRRAGVLVAGGLGAAAGPRLIHWARDGGFGISAPPVGCGRRSPAGVAASSVDPAAHPRHTEVVSTVDGGEPVIHILVEHLDVPFAGVADGPVPVGLVVVSYETPSGHGPIWV
jgi:hypothetical protein